MTANGPSTAVPTSRSQLEQMLQFEQLEADTFRTKGPLWHPPGGRGVYGGVVIAQSLAAAQRTVDDDFYCHSLQSQFLLYGSADLPITYSVERVRGGRSYATRSVQAIQEGKCIYSALVSFARKLSKPTEQARHSKTAARVKVPNSKRTRNADETVTAGLAPELSPVSIDGAATPPQDRVLRCWVRAPENICQTDNVTLHQAILAYLSDWLAISVVAYIHGHFNFPELQRNLTKSALMDSQIAMLSTLNHSMYFHSSPNIRADEWMLIEATSPWAGDERGIANARVFSQEGTLLATYTQEGVFRLKQDGGRTSSNL